MKATKRKRYAVAEEFAVYCVVDKFDDRCMGRTYNKPDAELIVKALNLLESAQQKGKS